MITKRKIIIGLFICIVHISNAQKVDEQVNPNFVVVELFTSQGCSSCPKADKVLSEVIDDARKNNKPVYALSFHVDYWNKYGWKDPYSNFRFTKRQNNYVSALNADQVYTPQIFVNGKTHFVGSDKAKLQSEINKELKAVARQTLQISKSSISKTDTLVLNYATSKADKNYSLVIAVVQRGLSNKIGKGENSGKTLTYDNVVRVFEIFPVDSAKGNVQLPLKKFKPVKNCSLIAYVQQKQTKQIFAATGFDF